MTTACATSTRPPSCGIRTQGCRTSKPTTKTLYWRQMNLRRLLAKWKVKGPTAVIEHGANPGLISHFTKQGLIDIGAEPARRQEG